MKTLVCNVPPKLMDAFKDGGLKLHYLATDDAVDIWLHGIVGDEYTETDSLSIGRILASNRGKAVNLRVNSPGGLAYDGVAMYNAIDQHDGPTTGIIEGLAGSAASLAVLACDTVKCHSTAVFHPHYSLIMAMGHQAQIRDALAIQERLDQDLEEVYSEASGRTIAQVKSDLEGPNGDGTRFSANEALVAGYVDVVISHNKNRQAAGRFPEEREMAMLREKRLAMISAIN